MPTVSGRYRTRVVGERGRRVGRVVEVIFDATEPRVVGYVVERPRFLWLFDRKDRMLAFDSTRKQEGRLHVTGSAAFDAKAEKRLGIEWDRTVVWRGMPVVAENGERVGTVGDVGFAKDGAVTRLMLSGGVASDVAVGTREIAGELVRGFDGNAIRVDDAAADAEYAGGAAAVAGRTAASASVAAERAAEKAKDAVAAAAASETGKAAAKAGKTALGWVKKAGNYVAEGWSDDDE